MSVYNDKILEEIVSKYFDTGIIKSGDILIVAVSGGIDSMCLIDAFYKLKTEIDYKLVVIHVHHGLRKNDADRDLNFVEKYCKSMCIDFKKARVKVKEYASSKKLSIEEAARILRYNEFEKLYKTLSKKNTNHNTYVLIAHHMKDQVETIIHNIVRGTGLSGIAGIKSENNYLLRPLLNISKEEIVKYANKYAIKYVEDYTNSDTKYTRNYIRKEIVDRLEKINNKAEQHIINLSNQAREAIEYIENESKNSLSKMTKFDNKSDTIIIDNILFKNEVHILQVEIIREIFRRLVSTLKDISKINIDDIIKLANKEKGGHLDLPYNITIEKKQNQLTFKLNKENISMSRRKKK